MSDFSQIQKLVAIEQQAADQLLNECLQSHIPLINQLGDYIINSGGKRLRPLLVLLSAKAFGYEGKSHILLATIIELLHTATLLHDDVVDNSQLRRGKKTANNIWGDKASVLVGDYLVTRAFELMVQIGDLTVLKTLATATNIMAEGEVLQLINCKNPKASEDDYMKVIRYKTGTLFSAATQLGAVLAKRSAEEIDAMLDYGNHLGAAFQLIDDVLDYKSSADVMGKNIGDDLMEGKPTLPLIYALQKANDNDATVLRDAIIHGGTQDLSPIMRIIETTGAITYTQDKAKNEATLAKAALQKVPDSIYRDALTELIDFSISRSH